MFKFATVITAQTRKIREKTVLDSVGRWWWSMIIFWAQQHVKSARMSVKRLSLLRRIWVFCNEWSTKIVSLQLVCATEHTAMIAPWHDERTRTGLLPADELFSVCELPMTTDFDAPLRTQTKITDKIYFASIRSSRSGQDRVTQPN